MTIDKTLANAIKWSLLGYAVYRIMEPGGANARTTGTSAPRDGLRPVATLGSSTRFATR